MSPHLLALLARFSYPAVFGLLLACGLGAPLSEDLILVATGALIGKGVCAPLPAVATAFAGVVIGDLALYSLGRKLGRKALGHRRLAKLRPPARMDGLTARFARWGALVVFAARFVAGMRACTFFAAGVLGVPRRRFLVADLAAAALWVPAVILLARAGASHLDGHAVAVFRRVLVALGVGAAAGLIARLLAAQLGHAASDVAGRGELEDAPR